MWKYARTHTHTHFMCIQKNVVSLQVCLFMKPTNSICLWWKVLQNVVWSFTSSWRSWCAQRYKADVMFRILHDYFTILLLFFQNGLSVDIRGAVWKVITASRQLRYFCRKTTPFKRSDDDSQFQDSVATAQTFGWPWAEPAVGVQKDTIMPMRHDANIRKFKTRRYNEMKIEIHAEHT